MARNNAYLSSGRGPESDECLTPRYGVLPIVKHLKARGYKSIWCPFDMADSQYVRVLESAGFNVLYTHLRCNQNFFAGIERSSALNTCDVIVSNIPFSIKDDILRALYKSGKPFAVLMPQNTLQSIKRVDMYMENGLEYLGFDRRINFYTRGELDAWKPANHFASGYFCKDVLPRSMQFEKLTPIQEPYLS